MNIAEFNRQFEQVFGGEQGRKLPEKPVIKTLPDDAKKPENKALASAIIGAKARVNFYE